ncbi:MULTISPECIES: FeoA domain-containing protein [Tatumella]|uniref:FeoA domain-containing protein n=1 Tax=Tatumella punctata TaxID=399969 RepID=A0ABW1VQ05_9GAMM|nr:MULTISPECIES: FeoA domain-containing protein [unclassified Tatumella]MBS0856016.1 FeoA domain-containing protein [Tatumella sp. JGM16]MBS0878075.1 FeoA domain-containing protein [Tatumella sp. JGM82]MBS0890434.1 FeoA domain-containing protein [Tatumella sp. JGM94]MBS0894677.1 FeoA domain-containing protein [Tatumella sp. JGM130]MBS0900890.1 FeoA domain-containing protein [Tatumella sp. JGM100]
MTVTAGHRYLIRAINPQTPPAFRQRLLSLGLLPGTDFQVVRVAPLGDPLEIHTRTMNLMLRRRDLRSLSLERLPATGGGDQR